MTYLSDIQADAAAEISPEQFQPEIGSDERRLQVRAYNHWLSLIGEEQSFPSIEDLDVEHEEFGAPGVLIDFTSGYEDPAIGFLGAALRTECRLANDIKLVRDVPGRSLISRLTDHCLQAVANEAPVGFEAEFTTDDERDVQYRGILLPFSSTGDSIDFVYGVLSWKAVDPGASAPEAVPEPAPRPRKKVKSAAAPEPEAVAEEPVAQEPEPVFEEPAAPVQAPTVQDLTVQDLTLAAAYAEIARLNAELTETRRQLASAEGEAAKGRFIVSSLRELVRIS